MFWTAKSACTLFVYDAFSVGLCLHFDISSSLFFVTKKGESGLCFASLVYGRFLSISTASTATHMTITIITAATPNSTVPVDARPVTDGAVGAGDAGGELA
jgi:hypothetical protein